MNRRQLLIGAAATALAPRLAAAQAARPLKIGVMNDMSSVYADYQGVGSVIAAKLAVGDWSAKLGVPVEIVSADHQNKPDIGADIARKLVRQRIRRRDHGPAELGGGARRADDRDREEQGGDRLRRRLFGDDRAEMLEELRPLDLRHLRSRPQHRQGDDRAGRQELVLHHRRLRLRQGPRKRIAPPR